MRERETETRTKTDRQADRQKEGRKKEKQRTRASYRYVYTRFMKLKQDKSERISGRSRKGEIRLHEQLHSQKKNKTKKKKIM